MATLTLTSKHTLSGTYTSSGDLTTPTESVAISDSQAYTNGTGANQANAFFSDTRSLAVSTPETIDLTADLTDAFGTTLALTSIREIIIRNNSTTSGEDITISGNVLGAFLGATTETITVPPGGEWSQKSPIDGFTVTNTTQDQLTVTPGAYALTYDLIITGTV